MEEKKHSKCGMQTFFKEGKKLKKKERKNGTPFSSQPRPSGGVKKADQIPTIFSHCGRVWPSYTLLSAQTTHATWSRPWARAPGS